MNINTNVFIMARLSHWLTRTAHIVTNQDYCDKCTTDKNKNKNTKIYHHDDTNILSLRSNATIGTIGM